MAFVSRYDPRSRYRHRSQQRMVMFATIGLIGVICAGIGYGIGYQSSRLDELGLKAELTSIQGERDKLRESVTRLMANNHSATIKYQQIEEQLQADMPAEGPLKTIVEQIRDQLNAGADPDRIVRLIKGMNPPRNCADPETRRFIVQTPKNKAADSVMMLADGAITIRASGAGAVGKTGKDEAWFDPARPVTVTFSWKGEKGPQNLERSGSLPLSQVLVAGNREYRMTLAAGAKSFMKVTFDSCDYP